ncbi:unnamed protein product [Heterobilharzia americana]|nr:unnamed protein product [Heterobilharzia americana]
MVIGACCCWLGISIASPLSSLHSPKGCPIYSASSINLLVPVCSSSSFCNETLDINHHVQNQNLPGPSHRPASLCPSSRSSRFVA